MDGLKELERKTKAIQDAIVLGDTVTAMRDLSDVRVKALECVDHLVRARIGKYQQREKATAWNRPAVNEDKTAAQAVTQVMTLRRS